MTRLLKQFVHEEDGAGMVEYGLLVALIGVALIAVTMYLGGGIAEIFGVAGDALIDAPDGDPATTDPGYGSDDT
ncbi:MAG: Flp family type IVb pilin [Phycisphaeraceae bacterium]